MMLVTAGVIVRGSEVLACQRRADGDHPGKWEFPGGKCEPGETPEQCLRRELHEELRIDADIGRELWRARHQYPGREPLELWFFLVPGYRGALINQVFAEIRWVAIDQLAALDFLDGDADFIVRLQRGDIRVR
jgi:8-oxo-dGTP diphosphatase